MKRQLAAIVLAPMLGCVGTAAMADGDPKSIVAPPCCEAPFAGFYVGGALGYEWQKVETFNEILGLPADDGTGGVTFGGYVGYNWQACCHPVVLGVEADFNYMHPPATAYEVEVGPSGLVETTSLESAIQGFGTLRARLGFVVHDHLLLYATGGLAYGRVKHTLFDDCVGCGNSTDNLGPFGQSNKDWQAGWTVGGGAELLHDSHWALRAETLYVDLGSATHDYLIDTPLAIGEARTKWEDTFWIARLGVSYLFNADDLIHPVK